MTNPFPADCAFPTSDEFLIDAPSSPIFLPITEFSPNSLNPDLNASLKPAPDFKLSVNATAPPFIPEAVLFTNLAMLSKPLPRPPVAASLLRVMRFATAVSILLPVV